MWVETEELMPERISTAVSAAGDFEDADYRFASTHLRVKANDERLIRWVSDLLAYCRADEGGGVPTMVFYLIRTEGDAFAYPKNPQARLLYHCSMFDCWEQGAWRWLIVPDMALVWCDLERNLAVATVSRACAGLPWAVGHYVFYPLWIQMLKQAGLFHTHAAGAALGGRGLLVPGPSGCGKSTLALNLVKNGFDFLSDDAVFLENRDGRVVINGFLEEVKVREASARLFPGLSPEKNSGGSDAGRPKLHFDIEEFFGSCVVETAEPGAVVFPKFTGAPATTVKKMSRANGLAAMFRYSMFMADSYSNAGHFQTLSDLVVETPCYEAEIGTDNQECAGLLKELLEG